METLIGVIIGALFVFYLWGKKELEKEKEHDVEPNPTLVIKGSISYESEHEDEYSYEPPPVEYYWEDPVWVSVTARLEIAYIDSKGSESNRIINISGYDGSAYLRGFCELREEQRTFRIDRIKNAIDIETGALIENVPVYLLEKYKQSPEYKLSYIFEKHSNIIKVLLYIGKADGQLRAKEKQIICSVIKSILKDKNLPDNEIIKFLSKMKVPSLHGFKLAFGQVCKIYPKQTKKVYEIAKKIIDTQKKVHHNEREALDYMLKKMKKEGLQ